MISYQFNMSVFKRLEELERRRSWLVDKTGLSRGFIYDGLKNNANWSLESASLIANALGLTIDELIKGEWDE